MGNGTQGRIVAMFLEKELENMNRDAKLAGIKDWVVRAQNSEGGVDWHLLQPYRDWLIGQLNEPSARSDYKQAVAAALRMIEKLDVPVSVLAKAVVEKVQNGRRCE